MTLYNQLYAKHIYLLHFCHFSVRYLENLVNVSATTKKKVHCSDHL